MREHFDAGTRRDVADAIELAVSLRVWPEDVSLACASKSSPGDLDAEKKQASNGREPAPITHASRRGRQSGGPGGGKPDDR